MFVFCGGIDFHQICRGLVEGLRGLWECFGVVWVGFLVYVKALAPKSRFWLYYVPVGRPSGVDLGGLSAEKSIFAGFADGL